MSTSAAADPASPSSPSSPASASRREAWDFFSLLVRRDLKVRYAGSALGSLWNVIHPVMMILIYIIIFSALITNRPGSEASGRDYVIHLCAGMIVWLVFADVLGRSTPTFVENANFIKRISFPPILLHASILANVLLVHSIGLAALWILLLVTGAPPPATWLWTFPILWLVGVMAAGIGMILSSFHVFFRDTFQVVTVVLQIGFWLNPIVYPASLIRESSLSMAASVLALNPLAQFIGAAQAAFGDSLAAPGPLAPAVLLICPLLSLGAGMLFLRRLMPEIRDGL